MFTGIIQAVGRIRNNEEIGDGLRIHVEAPELGLDTVKIGDSIAINGACMTVVEVDEKRFKVEVSAESLNKTAGLDRLGCHQRCFSDDQRSGRHAGRHPHQH